VDQRLGARRLGFVQKLDVGEGVEQEVRLDLCLQGLQVRVDRLAIERYLLQSGDVKRARVLAFTGEQIQHGRRQAPYSSARQE
jgi:hypothetical protein